MRYLSPGRSVWRVCACAGAGCGAAAALLGALLLLRRALEPVPVSPLRHLPLAYWAHRLDRPHLYPNSSCVRPPAGPHHLHRASPFWQLQPVPAGPAPAPARSPLAVYAAYWDERHDHVTVLVHVDRPPPLQCFFWYYNSGAPVSAPAEVSSGGGTARCSPPPRAPSPAARHALAAPPPPAAVSLAPTSFRCGRLRNMLNIQFAEEMRPVAGFGGGGGSVCVCAAWARRGDAAVRLLEWLTALQHFGVRRVYFYLLHAHQNVYRVLENFRHLVELMPYASPPLAVPAPAPVLAPSAAPPTVELGEFGEYVEYGEEPPPPEPPEPEAARRAHSLRAGDLAPYNDCLLRARHAHRWALLLDVDEILLPVKHGGYARLARGVAQLATERGGKLPDVLSARRYWFPQLLQRGLPPPPHASAGRVRTPPYLPPGRLFSYLWRAPSPLYEDKLTGKMLQTESVDHVEAEGPVCKEPCVQWDVNHTAARLHWYPARCGGRTRGVCRGLRMRAVADSLLLRFSRLRADAEQTQSRLPFLKHSPEDDDDN